MEHSAKVTLHWVLQGLAVTSATFGFAAIYMNKENFEYPHFQTPHGNWGLWTFISSHVVVSGGLMAKYSFQLRAFVKPVIAKLVHSAFGIVVYAMAMITIALAFLGPWGTRNVAPQLNLIILVIISSATGFLLYWPVVECVKRFKTAFITGAKK